MKTLVFKMLSPALSHLTLLQLFRDKEVTKSLQRVMHHEQVSCHVFFAELSCS